MIIILLIETLKIDLIEKCFYYDLKFHKVYSLNLKNMSSSFIIFFYNIERI